MKCIKKNNKKPHKIPKKENELCIKQQRVLTCYVGCIIMQTWYQNQKIE